MNIFIDNVDFWDDFEAMRYWSHPNTYSAAKRKEECYNYVMSSNYWGSRKMDGAWNMIIRDMEGNYHMRSRKAGVDGSYVDKAEWIPRIIRGLNIPNGSAVIGEIYLPNDEGSRKITSILNCLKEKCLKRQEERGYLHFYAFDIVAWNGRSLINSPFKDRIFKYLYKNFRECISTKYVEIADYKCGQDLWDTYEKILEDGGEGIVITQENTKYLCGKKQARTTVKMKKELTDTIDAFYDGNYKPAKRLYEGKFPENWLFWENTKTNERVNTNMYNEYANGGAWEPVSKAYYYGWAGSLSFSVMREGKPYHIGYISGVEDDVKRGVVEEPEKWLGRVAEINAMQTERIDGGFSLRHGRIIGWRTDKDMNECDYSQIS